MALNDLTDQDHYARKGDLDDLHRRINRDVRHALDEALGRQSADLNQRMDLKFKAVDQRFTRLEATLDAKFDAIDQRFAQLEVRFDALLRDLRSAFKAP